MLRAIFFFIVIILVIGHFLSPNEGVSNVGAIFNNALKNVESGLKSVKGKIEILDKKLEPVKEYLKEKYNINLPSKKKTYQKEVIKKENNNISEGNNVEEKIDTATYIIIELKNSFAVKGKLLNQINGNFTVEVDGLPVDFVADEIKTFRLLTPDEYKKLLNRIDDFSS